jgi:hypothetical protein
MAYRYRTLADGEIRLLLLQPGPPEDPIIIISIVHSQLRLSAVNPFEALSYAWGDAYAQEQILTPSGEVLSVTLNLANALRRLQYQDRER